MDVQTFLHLPFSEHFTLLAGEGGLANDITGVNILDNPKAMTWLSPGELIVTSGYFFSDSLETMDDFFQSFKRLNISAICIKPQIYLNPIPEELLRLCHEFDIPLIEIPYGLAFSKVLTTVMNLLADPLTESVQMALDINSKFIEYGLEDNDINYLSQKLEELLGNPVLITDSNWKFLSNTHSKAFLPYKLQSIDQPFFDLDCLKSLPDNLEQLKHPVNIRFTDGENGLLLPVFIKEVTYGYLLVIQKNRPLLKRDYIALEHASFSIALKIVHQAEKERIENRVLRDFYRELLSGKTSVEELKSYIIDFNYGIPYAVFMFTVDNPDLKRHNILQTKYDEDRLMRNVLTLMNTANSLSLYELHVFKQGNYFIGLLGINKKDLDLKVFFKELERIIQYSFASEMLLNIYVGSVQPIEGLHQSFHEAQKMIPFTKEGHGAVYFIEDFFLENFFQTHISQAHAEEFIQQYLKPLLDYDQQTDSHLIQTLSCYLSNQQNLAATSREMFIHRNTLLYRIEKIETLLNCRLTDATVALGLGLALKFLHDYPAQSTPLSL